MSTAVMASRRPVESAYDRHVRMLQEARVYYRRVTGAPSAGETDADVLRAAHRFVRDERADAVAVAAGDWRTAMAAKYYEKLFKEYALADVSRYKEGMIGMRWRTEAEVVAGKCVPLRAVRDRVMYIASVGGVAVVAGYLCVRMCPVPVHVHVPVALPVSVTAVDLGRSTQRSLAGASSRAAAWGARRGTRWSRTS